MLSATRTYVDEYVTSTCNARQSSNNKRYSGGPITVTSIAKLNLIEALLTSTYFTTSKASQPIVL